MPSAATALVAGVIAVPPLELNVTLNAVHLAQTVMLLVTSVPASTCVPPVCAVYQPAKPCPALVGFAGNVPTVAPYVLVSGGALPVPPFKLKFTVNVSGVHLAQTVMLLVIGVVANTCVPPVCAVNHPAKVCPALVGLLGHWFTVPLAAVAGLVAGFIAVPPLELNVTLNAVHLAQNVTLLVIGVAVVIRVPPVWAVYQPAKPCPALVGFAGNVPTVVPYVLGSGGALPVPPFKLKFTVNAAAACVTATWRVIPPPDTVMIPLLAARAFAFANIKNEPLWLPLAGDTVSHDVAFDDAVHDLLDHTWTCWLPPAAVGGHVP